MNIFQKAFNAIRADKTRTKSMPRPLGAAEYILVTEWDAKSFHNKEEALEYLDKYIAKVHQHNWYLYKKIRAIK